MDDVADGGDGVKKQVSQLGRKSSEMRVALSLHAESTEKGKIGQRRIKSSEKGRENESGLTHTNETPLVPPSPSALHHRISLDPQNRSVTALTVSLRVALGEARKAEEPRVGTGIKTKRDWSGTRRRARGRRAHPTLRNAAGGVERCTHLAGSCPSAG